MTRRILEPNDTWTSDWRCGVEVHREREVSRHLLNIFQGFWQGEKLGTKSLTTRRRYSDGLHALGGYLVEKSFEDDWSGMTAVELLWDALAGGDDGPLIHHDHEPWQRDLDTVCRRLYRYLDRVGAKPPWNDGAVGT